MSLLVVPPSSLLIHESELWIADCQHHFLCNTKDNVILKTLRTTSTPAASKIKVFQLVNDADGSDAKLVQVFGQEDLPQNDFIGVFAASKIQDDRDLAARASSLLQLPLLNVSSSAVLGPTTLHFPTFVVSIARSAAAIHHERLLAVSAILPSPLNGSTFNNLLVSDIQVGGDVFAGNSVMESTVLSAASSALKSTLPLDKSGVFHVLIGVPSGFGNDGSEQSVQVEGIEDWEGLPLVKAVKQVHNIDFLAIRKECIQGLSATVKDAALQSSTVLRYFHLNLCDSSYVQRADFVSTHLQLLSHVHWNISAKTLQELRTPYINLDFGLLHGFSGAALFSHSTQSDLNEALLGINFKVSTVDYDPLENNVVAFLGSGSSMLWRHHHFSAFAALGFQWVLLDDPKHWMFDADANKIPYHFRPIACVAIDTNPDDGLSQRIVDAIESSGIRLNGIFAISDVNLIPTACAALKLGLPTSTPESYAIAIDKLKTRELAPSESERFYIIRNKDDLVNAMMSGISYPCVLKPRQGQGSLLVTKCIDETDLLKTWEDMYHRSTNSEVSAAETVLEPFVDGPEVDVNMIIQDGKLLFCEICDQDPCPGDSDDSTQKNFLETGEVYPSSLPISIQQNLCKTSFELLLKMGFQTGLFHVEARVDKNNRCFVIEVNARVPGFGIPEVILRMYHVDYIAVIAYTALGRDLKCLLNHEPSDLQQLVQVPRMPLWIRVACPHVYGPGTVKTEDVLGNLRGHPNLVKLTPLLSKGATLPDPKSGAVWFAGRIEISSRVSREDLDMVSKDILGKVHVEVLRDEEEVQSTVLEEVTISSPKETVVEPMSITAADQKPITSIYQDTIHPGTSATKHNLFQLLFLTWLSPILKRGYQNPLNEEDLSPLQKENTSNHVLAKFSTHLKELKNRESTRSWEDVKVLRVAMMKTFLPIWLGLLLLYFFGMLAQVAVPFFLEQTIVYLTNPENPSLLIKSGIGLAFSILVLQWTSTLCNRTYDQLIRSLRLRVQSLLVGSIFEKSIKLHPDVRSQYPAGKIMNFVGVDVQMIGNGVEHGASVIILPLQVIICIALLVNLLGNAVWVGFASWMVLFVLQNLLFPITIKMERTMQSANDERLTVAREMVYNIRYIKMIAQENWFLKKVNLHRSIQIAALQKWFAAFGTYFSLTQLVPIALPTVTIVFYSIWSTGVFDVAKVISSLALFNILFLPILRIPQLSGILGMTWVSWKRVSSLLVADEVVRTAHLSKDTDVAIEVTDVTSRWPETAESLSKTDTDLEDAEAPKDFKLRDISFSIKKGSLTAISPWIFSGSIKDNITLWGRSSSGQLGIDESRLAASIKAACLDEDLKAFANGVDEVIGEKGTLLSGGQKSRLSLARAFYFDADIYMMDDVLSSLDARTCTQVFKKGILKHLSDTTRLLATHQVNLLKDFSDIIVVDNGRIAERGSYKDLVSVPDGLLARMVQKSLESKGDDDSSSNVDDRQRENDMEDTSTLDTQDSDVATSDAKGDQKSESHKDTIVPSGLVSKEDRVIGGVKWSTFASYIKATGGWVNALVCLFFGILKTAVGLMANYWIIWVRVWAADNFKKSTTVDPKSGNLWYLSIYGYLGLGICFCLTVMNILVILGSLRASRYYHNGVITSLLRATVSWYDRNPAGRIISRISQDMESMDTDVWDTILLAMDATLRVMGIAVLVAVVSYWLSFTYPFIFVTFFYISKFYRTSFRELKRLNSMANSPLQSHISESLNGHSSIRAFGVEEIVIGKQRVLADNKTKTAYHLLSTSIWVSLRIEFVTSIIPFLLVIVGSLVKSNAAVVGLALQYSLLLVDAANLLLQQSAKLENELACVERLEHYIHNLEHERPNQLPQDPKVGSWPLKGEIELKNLSVSYPNHPDRTILKSVSLKIGGGEKVAIVGRSGCGKSTLMNSLLRVIEPTGGSMSIDGVDLSTLGLHALRKGIHIIPQDPVLFEGTLRSNLTLQDADTPFCTIDDRTIWQALEHVQMHEYVASLSERLDSAVTEGGDNFSVGYRQLLALGRALCVQPRPKVLLMDEATSSVDGIAMDQFYKCLQETDLKSATILMVIHRISTKTLEQVDKVIVMDNGEIVEVGSANELLLRKDGWLRKLVDAAEE
ncbi:ATP-binding cassette sub- C member 8 [Chytridiales sp. JEL 0842]|nr:ATP-binding cassette sub- C member 8 [Chytridiales sp. JEL 0842]